MSAEVLQAHDVETVVARARAAGLIDDHLTPASAAPGWQAQVAAGPAPLPPLVSLRADQTPVKDQQQRGTCFAFATAGGMEAALNRRYGREVDLSEQYLVQVYKTSDASGPRTVTNGLFDTNSSLWGFQGNSNCVEAAARMALPVEGAAPYLDQPELVWVRQSITAANPAPGADPAAFTGQAQLDAVEWSAGIVPLMARQQADYRVTGFHQVGAGDFDVKTELAAGREVVMDIPGHVVLVIGYDTPNGLWEIKNSWGEATPFWVPVGTWFSTFQGGYAIDGVELLPASQPHGAWLGRWRLRVGDRTGELVVHRVTDRNTSLGKPAALGGEAMATRLGRAVVDGQHRDVNGWVSADGSRLVMFVAPDPTPTSAGARVGTRHEVVLEPDWMSAMSAGAGGDAPLVLTRPEAVTQAYAPATDRTDLGLRQVGAQPALVSWAPERLDVLVPAAEGFGHASYADQGWTEWERFAGAAARLEGAGRGVSATSWGSGRLDVFLTGEEGQLHHTWFDDGGGWGQWDDVGGGLEPGLPVAAVSRSTGAIEVFAISSYGVVVTKVFQSGQGWPEWRPIDEIPSRRIRDGLCGAADSGGIWLTATDASTRRPLLRRFDIHQGWLPWVELDTDAAAGLPVVVAMQDAWQVQGKPVTASPHVFWLPASHAGAPELRYSTRAGGGVTTASLALSGGSPRGVAASSWGASRLDVVVTLESPDGDLNRISSVDHLWSGDAGAGFGIETLGIS